MKSTEWVCGRRTQQGRQGCSIKLGRMWNGTNKGGNSIPSSLDIERASSVKIAWRFVLVLTLSKPELIYDLLVGLLLAFLQELFPGFLQNFFLKIFLGTCFKISSETLPGGLLREQFLWFFQEFLLIFFLRNMFHSGFLHALLQEFIQIFLAIFIQEFLLRLFRMFQDTKNAFLNFFPRFLQAFVPRFLGISSLLSWGTPGFLRIFFRDSFRDYFRKLSMSFFWDFPGNSL